MEIDLVFDASNWNVERKISVVAFNDDVDELDEIRTIYPPQWLSAPSWTSTTTALIKEQYRHQRPTYFQQQVHRNWCIDVHALTTTLPTCCLAVEALT